MENKLLTAQYILKNASGQQMAGFNRRVYGNVSPDILEGFEVMQGYEKANDMINDGSIYYTHNFHKLECKGINPEDAFLYGGFWVCDSCGKRSVDKGWWNIKVFKDGNEWICIGEGFENLQISETYAFGKTKEQAILNYSKLYTNKQ